MSDGEVVVVTITTSINFEREVITRQADGIIIHNDRANSKARKNSSIANLILWHLTRTYLNQDQTEIHHPGLQNLDSHLQVSHSVHVCPVGLPFQYRS